MTLEQIALRAQTVRRQHLHYGRFVDQCVRILQQAHDFGWRVTLAQNDERSIRKAESLLGVHIRGDFKPSTRLSKLIYDI